MISGQWHISPAAVPLSFDELFGILESLTQKQSSGFALEEFLRIFVVQTTSDDKKSWDFFEVDFINPSSQVVR